MNQLFQNQKTRGKLLLLAISALLIIFGAWLFGAFNTHTSGDDAKYERLQGLAQTCCRLDTMDRRLPPRISKFIRLHDFRNREIGKHDLLRIELLTSGYLTNATFDITNPPVAMRRILPQLVKAFGAEAMITGITLSPLRGYPPSTRELITITCRLQDLVLLEDIVSGNSNAPAKPIQEIPALFEGDVPGGGAVR